VYKLKFFNCGITAIATVQCVLEWIKVRIVNGIENSIDFLLIVVVLGTIFIFKSFVQNTGNYLSSILELSTGHRKLYANWQNAGPFLLGWWIAWSPS
jgi:choline/glycine/proline betaine transport protein